MAIEAPRALTIQRLEWLLSRPRQSVWEDACSDGPVECARQGDRVEVTATSRSLLDALQGRPQ